ncbi:hypothetical protein CRG98_009243 [Punica granatum]|uniref:Phytocyanin domain-containing protein n=1 Tax=Punica granatum TaxID=22663 RepID=A0A2I0KPY6_PUNGR|nr:hypothetical protein CRG98_009243 [Punica granatum]
MAALSTCRSVLLFLILFIFLQALFVASTEFEVGGDDGWAIPKSKNVEDMYNQWASKNRFKVNDTINFKYEKDSLMEVNEDEYKKCKSSQPLFFANNGNTNFTLDRPVNAYFLYTAIKLRSEMLSWAEAHLYEDQPHNHRSHLLGPGPHAVRSWTTKAHVSPRKTRLSGPTSKLI